VNFIYSELSRKNTNTSTNTAGNLMAVE